ncbi:MAG: response regulator transcription factor [Gallionellaceae bacterium]
MRIILVDDHKILLDTLSILLEKETDIEVVGTANDGRTALKLVASLIPDAVVIDIAMPGMNGIEVTRRLLMSHPQIKIVALSGFIQKPYVLEMLEAGASAYIIKENAASELVRALRSVIRGQKYLCPEVAAAVINNAAHSPTAAEPKLGPREREVLQLLAEGCSSPEIGRKLFISTATVDVHRRNIMKKLDIHNVADLTKYAIRNGLTSA